MNTKLSNLPIKSSRFPINMGVLAGIAMAIILFLFQVSGNDISPGGKLVNYIILFGVITYALFSLTSHENGPVFKKGVMAGLKISLVAAIVLVIANVILYLVNPELAFSKYSLMPDLLIQMATISAIIFFETFVIGNIITFITMQYFKNRSDR